MQLCQVCELALLSRHSVQSSTLSLLFSISLQCAANTATLFVELSSLFLRSPAHLCSIEVWNLRSPRHMALLTTSSLVGGSVSSVLFTILIPSSLFPTHDPAPRISCSSSWTCLQSTQLSFSFVSAVLSPPSLHSRHTVLSGFLALICRPRPRYSGGPPSYAIILLLFNTNTFGPCRPSSLSPRVWVLLVHLLLCTKHNVMYLALGFSPMPLIQILFQPAG